MTEIATARRVIDDAIGRVATACVVLAERAGERVAYACGTLDPETDATPCAAETWFDLASLTKIATTALALTFVRDGTLSLDQPFREIWPPFGDEEPSLHQVITRTATLRHVLTHTAGLPAWRHYYEEATGLEAIVALASSERLAYPPGRGYAYSDLGYVMLTAALARVGDAPFARLLADRVLRPLGLGERDLGFLPEDPRRCAATERDTTWRKRRVRGEVHDENAFAMGGVAGHAGLFGTADAVARLMRVFTRGEVIGAGLAAEACRDQATGPNAPRGLGLALKAPRGASCGTRFSSASYGHVGFTGTSAWYDPEQDLLVVLLTNAVYYRRDDTLLYPFRIAVHEGLS